MLIQTQTLKTTLETLIEQHGLAEVLDRLADISHHSNTPNPSQITKLLEDAVQLGLAQSDAVVSTH
ncbi:MAG: hypothetical protein DCF22_18945 [Leptolyngbya sp.]|nr:MAG: hypothetical protein DCF22_18945 [Leptolyngbya sp.]